jgi:hypothetical protein
VSFEIVFKNGQSERTLHLLISDAGIHHDPDRSYERRILDAVRFWVDSEQGDGKLECFS